MDGKGSDSYPSLCKIINIDLIEKLLKSNSIDFAKRKCSMGLSALSYIVQRKPTDSGLKLLITLVENYELDIHEIDDMKQTCLFYAAREGSIDCCSYLIKKGINIDHKDNCGQTSMFYAAREGHTNIIKLLVENGSNINTIDEVNGETPLFYAAVNDHKETAEIMIVEWKADPGIRNHSGKTAAFMARKINGRSTSLLLEQKTKKAIRSESNKEINSQILTSNNIKVKSFPKILVSRVKDIKSNKKKSTKLEAAFLNSALQTSINTITLEVPTPSTSDSKSICSSKNFEINFENLKPQENCAISDQTDSYSRKKYRLEFKENDGCWIIPTNQKLKEFESRFPEIALWVKDTKRI